MALTANDAAEAVKRYGSVRKAAEALGCDPETIRRALKRAGRETAKPAATWSESGDDATWQGVVNTPIRTLDDLTKAIAVDWNVWAVEKWEATAWTTTVKLGSKESERVEQPQNYRVHAKLKRRISQQLDAALDIITAKLAGYRPKLLKANRPQSGHLLEFSPFDVHNGRRAWLEPQSLKDQGDVLANAAVDILDKSAGFGIERIVWPLGQDYFQIDNARGETVNGTPQQTNAGFCPMFAAGHDSAVRALDILQRCAPVEVKYVPGNHDRTTSWLLCFMLSKVFAGHSRIRIDCPLEFVPRSYIRHGKVIIGLTHGDEEKHADLGHILASECRQWWAETTYAEFHVGHYHKVRETRFNAADTHGNVVVRVLPSLSKTDEWHHRKGYVTGTRAAQAFVWGKTGLEAMLETRAA